jgi:HK97 gp10 family phage protein
MAYSGVKIEGLEGLQDILGDLGPRAARNLNRSTIHAVAGIVRKEARKKAPKDEGTLKKAIKAKRRKPRHPDYPYSDVMVEHGRNAKNDAWYWRFVEYGTQDLPARPFIQPAIDGIRYDIPAIYRKEFANKLAKMLAKKRKR